MSVLSDILSSLGGLLDKIPIWKKLKTLPERIDALEKRIHELETRGVAPKSEKTCPACGERYFFVFGPPPDPARPKKRIYKCKACDHVEEIDDTPKPLLPLYPTQGPRDWMGR